jgi:hypothetical protein
MKFLRKRDVEEEENKGPRSGIYTHRSYEACYWSCCRCCLLARSPCECVEDAAHVAAAGFLSDLWHLLTACHIVPLGDLCELSGFCHLNDFRQLMYLLIHYLRCSGFLDTDDEGMMMVTRLEHLEVIKFDEM